MPLTEAKRAAIHEMVRTWVEASLQMDATPYILVGVTPEGRTCLCTCPVELASDADLLRLLKFAVSEMEAYAFDETVRDVKNL